MPKLTADLVYGFSVGILQSRFDSPKPTPEFHKEIWEYCCSPDKNVAIAAPRGHAKSTAVTLAYTLASVLFRESRFVVIVSDTEAQSIQFLNDIKTELLENDELRDLFLVDKLDKDNERDIIVSLKPDYYKFRILVRSSGQSVRGLKWRNMRPDLIVGDDLENDEIVLNQERRDKFKAWFFGALLPVLSDHGKIRLVGTILHFDSLLERLMPPTTGPRSSLTLTQGLKQVSLDKSRKWKSIKYRGHTDYDDFSELLWPEKFSKERYLSIRQDYAEQGIPEGYAQEYLNYPIAESTAYFRRYDFLDMDENDMEAPGHFYVGCDFAISQREKADYSVMVVGKLTANNMLNVVDVRRGRWDSKEIIEELFSIQERYNPEFFIFEKGQIESAIGPFLEEEMHKRNHYLSIRKEAAGGKDKTQRARAIQGRMRAGGVAFIKDADWYLTFEQELLRFDRGEHDDQVDAIAYLGLVLNKMVPGSTKDELEQELYEEDVEMAIREGFLLEHPDFSGRNYLTGY